MVLTAWVRPWLARTAVTRPHVLIAAVPGHEAVRIAAEATIAHVGGVLATSPADADVLFIAGSPGPRLTEAIDVIWAQLPGPRARVRAARPSDVGDALTVALELLADPDGQGSDAHGRRDTWDEPAGPADTAPSRLNAWPSPTGRPTAAREFDADATGGQVMEPVHDRDSDSMPGDTNDLHAGHSMGGHGGHEMGDMSDMGLPGGLMMADRAADRDGLKLDVLHVPLGPILPAWPAGLIIHTELQGDVIAGARAELLDTETEPGTADPSTRLVVDEAEPGSATVVGDAVAVLDALARFLVVAGWRDAAASAAALRDDLREDPARADAALRLRRLATRLTRSRLLRARGTGLGSIEGSAGSPELLGDVTCRWRRWLDIAATVLAWDGGLDGPSDVATTRQRVDLACELIVGLDLAAARLVVASLNIRPGERAPISAAQTIPVDL